MSTQTTVQFQLGQVVATAGALNALHRNRSTGLEYIQRHATGDWGVVCDEDKASNQEALQSGARILSAYPLADETRLWVITDAAVDRDGTRLVTTLLLPEEY